MRTLNGNKAVRRAKKTLADISQKALIQHLRIMAENGLVNRVSYNEIPPRVEYSLTELGESLKLIHNTTLCGNGAKITKQV